jgi:hypothetical protein
MGKGAYNMLLHIRALLVDTDLRYKIHRTSGNNKLDFGVNLHFTIISQTPQRK